MVEYQQAWNVKAIYTAVLAAVLMRSVSYIFLLFGIRETQYSLNIPFESLALDAIAALILFVIAFQRKYYIHLTLYLLQFLLIAYITLAKLDLEGYFRRRN